MLHASLNPRKKFRSTLCPSAMPKRQKVRTWEHLESKRLEKRFFQGRSWEHTEKKSTYKKS